MPLGETQNAIGVLTRLLAQQLTARTDATTCDVGRPEQAATQGDVGPKLNLFAYAIQHDAYLRNTQLDRGQEAPIWLCVQFLMTAIDQSRDTDSSDALDLLGQGMLALREVDMQNPSELALLDNPEPIKISFQNSEAELLSSVMQGTDERYRLSVAFEVRPLMLTEVAANAGAPLIRSVGEPATPGVLVLPTLGPRLDAVEPESFESGEQIVLRGGDLAADVVEVCFDNDCTVVPVANIANDHITTSAPVSLSAGSHAVTVRRLLPNGRFQSSNVALGRLRPTVTAAVVGALSTTASATLFGDIIVSGERLGRTDDAVFAGLYRDGAVKLMLEVNGSDPQTQLTVSVPENDALPGGDYRIIIRVNGEQAINSPTVNWS